MGKNKVGDRDRVDESMEGLAMLVMSCKTFVGVSSSSKESLGTTSSSSNSGFSELAGSPLPNHSDIFLPCLLLA